MQSDASIQHSVELLSGLDPRILLADHNLINQKVLCKALHVLGFRSELVCTGEELINAHLRRPYDLVFLDLKIPLINGLEAARYIRSSMGSSEQPYIIALTANEFTHQNITFFESGIDDVIRRPFRSDSLRSAMDAYLSLTIALPI